MTMSESDTPVETPVPRKPLSGRCSDHSAIVVELRELKQDGRDERDRRERSFTVLESEIVKVADKLSELRVSQAKLLGGVAALLALIQIALKFLPGGG